MRTFNTKAGTKPARTGHKRAVAVVFALLLVATLAVTTILSAQTGITAEAPPQTGGATQPLTAEIVVLPDEPTAGGDAGGDAAAEPLENPDDPAGDPAGAPLENDGAEDGPNSSLPDNTGVEDIEGVDLVEYDGDGDMPIVAFDENGGGGAGVTINGRKTVTSAGSAAPSASFTFVLTQIQNDQGSPLTGASVLSPNPMTKQVNTTGAGNYDFSFDITGFGNGVYYFWLHEQQGAANSKWDLDSIEYIIRVTVGATGRPSMDYRSRTGTSAPWGAWTEYISGTVNGTPSQSNVTIPAYTFNKSHNFTFIDDYFPGTNIGLGVQMANPRMRDTTTNTIYYPMCADGLKTIPASGQRMRYGISRDNTESALFFALRAEANSLGLPGLPTSDFNRFFGINVTHPDGRVGYMRCMLWAYEEYFNNGQQLNLDDPASWSTGSRPLRLVEYMLMVLDLRDTPANRATIIDTFKTINKNTKGIMQQYREGKSTSLNMSFSATGENTGTLSFGHDGYVPTNASGAEQYSTTLSWTPTSNVTVRVTRNGNTTTLSRGAAVYKTDTITVTNNSGGPVTFTLTDSAKYLAPGSVKADIMEVGEAPWDRQPVLLGTAEFVTLSCSLTTCGEPRYLPYTNTFTKRDETGPILPEVGGVSTTPFIISALLVTALLSVFLAGAFIYRFIKRRKCVT